MNVLEDDWRIVVQDSSSELLELLKFLEMNEKSENSSEVILQKLLQKSLAVAAIKKSNFEVVGFGRAITDYTTFAYLTDILSADTDMADAIERDILLSLTTQPRLSTVRHRALRYQDALSFRRCADFGFQRSRYQSFWLERFR